MISSPRRHLSVAVIMTSPVDLLYAVPVKIFKKYKFNSLYTDILLHQEFENTCTTLTKHLGYLYCFSSCESDDSSDSLGNGFLRNNHHFSYMSSSFQMPVELILLYILYIQLYIGTSMYNDI